MSSLKQQLKHIQEQDRIVRGIPAGGKKRPSFLFDQSEAADFDDESILALATEGLNELMKIDNTLLLASGGLFADKLVAWNLSLATKQELEEWRPTIATFLMHLSPHFLEKSAHKVLEWMVRKWRVNEVFVDELMSCILPFHETVPFVRMVQIGYFVDNGTWSFLRERVQQNGHTITRTLLAQRCTVDWNILDIVMKAWDKIQSVSLDHPDYKHASFYTSFVSFLLVETFAHILQPSDLHIIRFYQMAEAMVLSNISSPESIAGASMLILSLCERAELQEAAIESFVRKLFLNNSPNVQRITLLTLARLVEAGCCTSLLPELVEKIIVIPPSTLQVIVEKFRMNQFASMLYRHLQVLESKSSNVESLLSILAPYNS